MCRGKVEKRSKAMKVFNGNFVVNKLTVFCCFNCCFNQDKFVFDLVNNWNYFNRNAHNEQNIQQYLGDYSRANALNNHKSVEKQNNSLFNSKQSEVFIAFSLHSFNFSLFPKAAKSLSSATHSRIRNLSPSLAIQFPRLLIVDPSMSIVLGTPD